MEISTLKTRSMRGLVCGAVVALLTGALTADAAAQAPTTYVCTITVSATLDPASSRLRCIASPVQEKRSTAGSTSRRDEACVLVRPSLYYAPVWHRVCGPRL